MPSIQNSFNPLRGFFMISTYQIQLHPLGFLSFNPLRGFFLISTPLKVS